MQGNPAAADNPLVQQLFAYWQDRCNGGRLPARADIVPAEIPNLLTNLVLIEVREEGPPHYRVRLYGSAVAELRGEDLTGRFLDDGEAVVPHLHDRVFASYRAAIDGRAPVYETLHYQPAHRRVADYHRLVLPLSADDERVDMLLVGFFAAPVAVDD